MPDTRGVITDDLLINLIDSSRRVVDLGCGDGRLLERLRKEKQCSVLGIERDTDAFLSVVGRGIPVIQADLDAGLHDVPDKSFDFAVLSQTLQQVHRPLEILDEMLRVAARALVVVPNFGHWKVRFQVAWGGRAPVTDALPYEWYESPNVHFLTMRDFRDLAARGNFRIVKELPVIGQKAVDKAWLANLRAHSAIYVLERAQKT